MKRRARRNFGEVAEENFWPAFTDMISTIALIIFFLMLIVFINNVITGKNLEFAKKELANTERNLDASRAEISKAEDRLRLLQDEFEKTAAEVKKGQIELKLSESEVEKQQEIIAESNKELGNLRSKLEGIAVLRLNVLQKVKISIEENLDIQNDKELVLIADNGNIIINEGLVFDFNSYEIKDEGKDLLKSLAGSFEKVLDNEEIRRNIDAISIQGHTDKRGSSENNRELSSKRATAVVDYLMSVNRDLEYKYGSYFVASGYSEFRPINIASTEAAYSQNRRIEVSVILKDSNIQNVIDEYLKDSIKMINKD
ncbi:MAG: OmpA family protein [Bacillota bacterium]|nr:OmpA family protein [Bacillota bacterium]